MENNNNKYSNAMDNADNCKNAQSKNDKAQNAKNSQNKNQGGQNKNSQNKTNQYEVATGDAFWVSPVCLRKLFCSLM